MIKILGISILAVLIIIAVTLVQSSEAATTDPQSISKYIKSKTIKQIPGKTGWYYYMLKVCADDHHLAVTEVILSSDTETIYEGVNGYIIKGKCSFYGAVMKAKNASSLVFKITSTDEAVQKIISSKEGKLDLISLTDVGRYKSILGFY